VVGARRVVDGGDDDIVEAAQPFLEESRHLHGRRRAARCAQGHR
jgi:hypothetical protein